MIHTGDVMGRRRVLVTLGDFCGKPGKTCMVQHVQLTALTFSLRSLLGSLPSQLPVACGNMRKDKSGQWPFLSLGSTCAPYTPAASMNTKAAREV